MPLTDEFITKDKLGTEYINDITISSCKKCGLIQNPNNISFSAYYENYNYSSGHSPFVKEFMKSFADYAITKYNDIYQCKAQNVLEIGSGDGVQLKEFQKHGLTVLGVEPSENLQKKANKKSVKTIKEYFDKDTVQKHLQDQKYSITISSFTLDHIPQPKLFIDHLWDVSAEKSLTIFEIHDVNKINKRGEWCLFEHEHMIYTDENFWSQNLPECGFELIDFNPFPERLVRANSLIIVAKKIPTKTKSRETIQTKHIKIKPQKISTVKDRLDKFLKDCRTPIIGWGVGGRGIMTTALLENSHKFSAFFDTNFNHDGYYTPKTHIKIEKLGNLPKYKNATVIVFAFGYFQEISEKLLETGFDNEKIINFGNFLK